MFVLDTKLISELLHGKPNPSAQVRHWAAGLSNRVRTSASIISFTSSRALVDGLPWVLHP